MKLVRRFLPLALALLAGLAGSVLPGRAQAPSSRFAFADTTLLRDTLGLSFARLFETADSLQMLPDSLRSKMIRYRLPMRRLIAMADSMAVPVDSVGDIIDRERFNPFVNTVARTNFKYTTTYVVTKTSTQWENGGDYSRSAGNLLLNNSTSIQMARNTSGGRLSLQQTRNSRSEANWKLSPNFSLGGQAALSGYDNFDPRLTTSNEAERKSEFQLSSRMRQRPSPDFSSELNLLAGYLDLKNISQIKRGLSGDLNGRVRWLSGNWFSHDLSGGVNGNLARTRRPSSLNNLRTSDFSGQLRGALLLLQSAPVGLAVNYSAGNSRVETPSDADTVNRLLTSRSSADATIRMRLDNDRYLNLTGSAGLNSTLQGKRYDKGVRAQARWTQGPWALDSDYGDQIGDSRYPRRNNAFGYGEVQDNRTANATLARPLGRRIIARVLTGVSLSQFRSRAFADSANPPTPRDNYRQFYRVETQYNGAEQFNTKVALDVSLTRSVNIPATSTSNNSDTRSYRAEWSWSYRLLRQLTATQINTVQADYESFPFATDRNDVSLDYNTVTTLAAVLTPRLTIDVSHNARQQPRGDWRVLTNGDAALLPSDENLNYTLRTRVNWSPSPALSFSIQPEYSASDRNGTSNGVEAPARRSRHLNLNGNVNLNLRVAGKGQLSGSMGRNFSADRTTTYQNGLPQASPLAEQDFWNGTLQFSWEL